MSAQVISGLDLTYCGSLRNTAAMPRSLSPGQRAAVGAAVARRGELGLTQKQLAAAAGVSERTIGMFEAGRTWPRADTLAQIERLGLNWPVGYLTEYATKHREPDASMLDKDIADILSSDLNPDLKLRLVDRLRAIAADRVRDEAEDIELRLAELGEIPGGDEDRRTA